MSIAFSLTLAILNAVLGYYLKSPLNWWASGLVAGDVLEYVVGKSTRRYYAKVQP